MTPVDPALVDEGWWIVRKYNGELVVVYVYEGETTDGSRAVGLIDDEFASWYVKKEVDSGGSFLRKLDLEKLAGDAP